MQLSHSILPPRRLLALAVSFIAASACAGTGSVWHHAAAPQPDDGDSAAIVDTRSDIGSSSTAGSSPSAARVVSDSEWSGHAPAQVEQLLAGRVAGVTVERTPGGMQVRIRGAGGFMNTGEPLFVVDGMAIDVGADGLVDINPADVASIEVLKDPSALALWGSRAGNGVVLIRTKGANQQ